MAANAIWYASNLPAWLAFRHALAEPQRAQERVLRTLLRRIGRTAFGRAHGLRDGCDYHTFRRRVPLHDYAALDPWITRVRNGEPGVLTVGRVRRLATTSGTTAGRKLVPYTRQLQAELNRAIGPWIVDLFHTHPSLFGGRAYWSISPAARQIPERASAVPIGFDDDSEYLGGLRRHLVDAVLAVPSRVRHAKTMDEWRRRTVEHLKAAADLRLISVWHPSFLDLLFDGTERPGRYWPRLAVLSCWADGHSALGAAALAMKFPDATIQPKGLLATEGVVSIPFRGRRPLAVRSHFYEFIDERQNVCLAEDLQVGRDYEVVLTTGGGLYRYRLGDLVRVEHLLGRTPCFRFLGKSGLVSDRFGEKLAEPFVAVLLARLRATSGEPWNFALLAPDGRRYCLFVDAAHRPTLAAELDEALRENPHYAYCRDLGQLEHCVTSIVPRGPTNYLRRMTALGQRTGDIKAVALSNLDQWRDWL